MTKSMKLLNHPLTLTNICFY